jgi:alpha-tubulin suppressor-like RCC1 family protein
MKTILRSRRPHYVARAGIFLIALALIAGMTGCTVDGGVAEYDLTIGSTGPGSVSTPGEGTFTYDEGTVVDLVATPDDGCQFVNWTGDVSTVANVNAAATNITMNDSYNITANFQYIPMVTAGECHTVGLKSDGTVVAVGDNSSEQCDVGGWTGIVQVAAGQLHTVGLKSNGDVVAVGFNDWGQCDVAAWGNITRVAAGDQHTVGIKYDGTVVAVGFNDLGQCDVGGWSNITQVAAGYSHTVGVRSDGTVVAVGDDSSGKCDVSGWTNVVQVAAGDYHTVGLKSDGTVVAVGDDSSGQCDVGGWDLIP